jgi:hypothetical protein
LAVAKSRFYAEHLADRAAAVRGLVDLEQLPFVTKEMLAAHALEMLTDDAVPARVGISSGSTAGDSVSGAVRPPAFVFHSDEELRLLGEIHARLTRAAGAHDLVLQIDNGTHGAHPVAADGHFVLPLAKRFHVEAIRRILEMRFSFRDYPSRIESLVAPLNQLLLLANVLADHGSALRRVVAYGGYLGQVARRQLQCLAPAVEEIYGISEIVGATATRCRACGDYHFSPLVIPEVVPVSANVRDPYGELVLTGLAPFCALQPLIRYRTGDLVEVNRSCPTDVGVRPVGRLATSLVDSELGVLLPSFRAREVLDELPDVCRVPLPGQNAVGVESPLGPPLFRTSVERHGELYVLTLTIETAREPYGAHPGLLPAAERLAALTPVARELKDRGLLSVRVVGVPSGTLPPLVPGQKW